MTGRIEGKKKGPEPNLSDGPKYHVTVTPLTASNLSALKCTLQCL